MSIQYARIGTAPLTDDGWADLGTTTLDGLTFEGFETAEPEVPPFKPQAWPVTFTATIPTLDVGSHWYDALGLPAEPATHSLLIVTKVPFRDVPPRKRKGLTGKKYRQARRAFRRQRQAWVRAGRPELDQHIYLPRVRIEAAQ